MANANTVNNNRVLLLGGIAEAKQIAQFLIDHNVTVIYSIAGLVRQPDLDCEVRSGGFSNTRVDSIGGLTTFIKDNRISLIINATHPYAETMSSNAARVAARQGIPCWRFLRPGWTLDNLGDLRTYDCIEDLLSALSDFHRPFFTVGQGIFQHRNQRLPSQNWIVRSAIKAKARDGITHIDSIGPFSYEHDLALMQEHNVDALITKDSGGEAVAGKIRAARELNIPVLLIKRPAKSSAGDQVFDSVDSLLAAIAVTDPV